MPLKQSWPHDIWAFPLTFIAFCIGPCCARRSGLGLRPMECPSAPMQANPPASTTFSSRSD